MPVERIWIIVLLAVVLVGIVLARAIRSWLKYRGNRVVECPENRRPAGVVVDSGYAALTALGHAPELRLSSCSRWPERAGCGQECLAAIHAAPEDCLVRNIVSRWYEGKSCAACGRPFGEIQWGNAQPALLLSDKVSKEWTEVAPAEVGATMAAALPVCFACHTASRFVHEHPGLVIDRSRPVER